MRRPCRLLIALATLGTSSLSAQTEADIHISAESCFIGTLSVPCSDVGEKLRELERLWMRTYT